jgi:tetratricopeptide (TPR) repeat protein
MSDLNKALEINPKYDKAYYSRGNVYGQTGKYDEAVTDFSKAIEINPKYAAAYSSRGAAYAILGKTEDAKKDLRTALKLNPELKQQVKQISDKFKLGL